MQGRIRTKVLNLLIDRNPNFVSRETMIKRLSIDDQAKLDSVLQELIESEEIESQIDPREITGSPLKYYRLKNPNRFPVRDSIRLGTIDVPRLLSDSGARFLPETLNEQVELISEYTNTLEKRFANLVRKEQRRYWANVLGIFGALLAILALILTGLPKITTDPNLAFWTVVKLNLAQLLPLCIVLAVFVLVLRIVIR